MLPDSRCLLFKVQEASLPALEVQERVLARHSVGASARCGEEGAIPARSAVASAIGLLIAGGGEVLAGRDWPPPNETATFVPTPPRTSNTSTPTMSTPSFTSSVSRTEVSTPSFLAEGV